MTTVMLSGESLYGKVDHVPGLFYVKTRFLHVNFLPFLPQQSYVILDGSEKQNYVVGLPVQYAGVEIPLCRRSVRLAWLRNWAVATATVLILLGAVLMLVLADTPKRPAPKNEPFSLVGYFGERGMIVVCFSSGAAILLLAGLSLRLSRPTPSRALELCRLLDIEPNRLFRHFRDRVSRSELRALIGPEPNANPELQLSPDTDDSKGPAE